MRGIVTSGVTGGLVSARLRSLAGPAGTSCPDNAWRVAARGETRCCILRTKARDASLEESRTMPGDMVDLLVCTTCRYAASTPSPATPEPESRPGAELINALRAAAPEGLNIVAVECLSNCSRGCTIALRKPGAWTYVYGNLSPDTHLPTILDGAQKYRAAENGLVRWRERPEHFRKNCIARIPPLEALNA